MRADGKRDVWAYLLQTRLKPRFLPRTRIAVRACARSSTERHGFLRLAGEKSSPPLDIQFDASSRRPPGASCRFSPKSVGFRGADASAQQ